MYKTINKNNWHIVQDVAWKDYMIVPKYTMAGYTVMMKEIVDQINHNKISHIILQAGVGGMAAAMIAGIARYLENIPEIIVVEPNSAACVLESIKKGKIEK
jgi:diaminopropionate ammonia-lyase